MAQTTDTTRPTRPIHTVTVLGPAERAAVTRLMRRHTILGAAEMLGICRHAAERAALGAGVQRGTAALIRQALTRLAAEEPLPSSPVEPRP